MSMLTKLSEYSAMPHPRRGIAGLVPWASSKPTGPAHGTRSAAAELHCKSGAAHNSGPGGRWAKDVYGRPEAGGTYSTEISDWGGRAWKAPPCVEKDQLAAQPFGALRVLDGSSLTHVRQNTSREAVFACRRACLSTSTTRCSASRRVLLSRSPSWSHDKTPCVSCCLSATVRRHP